MRNHVHTGTQGNSKTDPTVTVSEAGQTVEQMLVSDQGIPSKSAGHSVEQLHHSSERKDPVEIITQRAQLDELANQPAELGKNWTAVVIDRQDAVFGTYLGDGKWIELGSAVPFCLSGRIALPARLVVGQA